MTPLNVLPSRTWVQRRGSRRDKERGSALVELAAILPLVILLFLGALDFGRVFYFGMAVAQAARAAAEHGAQSVGASDDVTGMRTAGKAAVAGDLTLIDGNFSPAPSRSCECATEAGVFSATSPVNTCTGNPCASGGHLVITVNVTVTKTFTTLVNYPRLPNTMPITRTTRIRVK